MVYSMLPLDWNFQPSLALHGYCSFHRRVSLTARWTRKFGISWGENEALSGFRGHHNSINFMVKIPQSSLFEEKKHKKEQEKGTTKVKFYLYIRTIMKLQISVRKYRPKNLKTYPVNCLGTLGYMGSNLSKFISLRFDSYQVLTKFVICIQEKNKLN